LFTKSGSGGTPLSTNTRYYNGDIPFLSIADITNSNGLIYKTEKYITIEGLNNSAAWIVPKEAIALAMYASVGKVAILKQNISTSQAFYNMVFNDLSVRNVVFYRLKSMELNEEWNALISTGTQSNLNAQKVQNLEITIPHENSEQTKIGFIFKNIDDLITLHQRK